MVKSGATRSLWDSTMLTTTLNRRFTSACLGCPDQRCAHFSAVELGREVCVESSFTPDPAVCATDAISRGDDGVMVVDEKGCIGCGLCVVRCPVGAIHLDVETAVARIERPSAESYEQRFLSPEEFETHRTAIAGMTPLEVAPFGDASRVYTQLMRAMPKVEGAAGQRALRLLARNTFLLSGAAGRLKNVGDNSSAAELLVDGGGHLLIVEVEPSTDVPDAVRRAIAGVAIAVARLGADPSGVSAAVVVTRLPNERVEYYRVAQDVNDRLGLPVYGLPLALLLLAIRSGGGNLGMTLSQFCNVNGSIEMAEVQRTFGDPGDPVALGLTPPK